MTSCEESYDSTIQTILTNKKNLDTNVLHVKDFLYKFENWMLPQSGKVWGHKISGDEKYSLKEKKYDYRFTELLFDVNFYPNKQVVNFTIDPVHMFQTMVSTCDEGYLVEVMKPNSRELLTTFQTNSSHLPSYDLHSDRVIFIDYAKNGRPNKVCEKIFGQPNVFVHYDEPRDKYQLKLIKTAFINRSLFKLNTEYLLLSSDEDVKMRVIWTSQFGKVDQVTNSIFKSKEYILFLKRKSESLDHELILYSCDNQEYQKIPTRKFSSVYDIKANHTYILIRYLRQNRLKIGIITIENLVRANEDFLEDDKGF